jgi:hypothetical protein
MQSKIIIEPAKQQALAHIQEYKRLVEIYELEKTQLETVIEQALMVERTAHYWREYERLKEMMSRFVGWEARHKKIATSQHYEIMLYFIEWLLPMPQTEEIETCREVPTFKEITGYDYKDL